MKKTAILYCLLIAQLSSYANITLPRFFTDHMVLQRNQSIPLWGWAAPGEKISITFVDQQKQVVADKSGKWTLRLDPETAGGPYELSIKGMNEIILTDVMIGDVWICSGQSNMEWTVAQSMNAVEELAKADNPYIRHIKINRSINSQPQDDVDNSSWKVSTPVNTGSFTAVGYFFAKKMFEVTRVAQGLINASWGGTNIETWISRQGFESSDEFKDMIAAMPQLSLDSLLIERQNAVWKRLELLQGKDFKDKPSAFFIDPATKDDQWNTINQPQIWEEQSIGEIDGIVWLRRTFTANSLQAGKESILHLAMIDDEDSTFLNGTFIGATTQWNLHRQYNIPAGLLKEGKNVISIKVVDNGGGGGIWGKPADLKLVTGPVELSLAGNWKCFVLNAKTGSVENAFPSLLYNAMIHPLVPYGIKGFLWYQGESNASRAYQYRKSFPLLINDWRRKWNNDQLPFYFVQLATFATEGNSNDGCAWAELREAQTLTLSVPNTGMCVTTDIGNPNDIHPTNKQDVGYRIAGIALHDLFNQPIDCYSPSFDKLSVVGNKAMVEFKNAGKGLMITGNQKTISGFEIAGADQHFYPAIATLDAENKVILTCKDVSTPAAVRFGWKGDASANNLSGKNGLPVIPFRTDDWKTITTKEKYKLELKIP